MAALARVGDRVSGIYYSDEGPVPCSGTIETGDPSVFAGMSVAHVGSIVKTFCGVMAVVTTGSSTFFCDLGALARVGDEVRGPRYHGYIVEGDPEVNVE